MTHPESSFLQDLVIALAGALLVLLPSRRLKIPPPVGFMLTGILIGPGGFAAIADPSHVRMMAEIGVSVLLFTIGLEFSLARIRELARPFLVAGPLQVLGTIVVVAGVLLGLGVGGTLQAAVFAGMLVTLSSTAMVLRVLGDRDEMLAPQGRLAIGILLFQDIAIVPMVVLVPALAGNQAIALGPRLLIGLAAAAAIVAAARIFMPRIVDAVIRSGVRELYVMMAVAACLGAALLTQSLGLSPALGAFLAGLLVGESEYAHQIVSEILPFRDLFASLFFISIGMLLAPSYLSANLAAIGGWLVLIISVKALVAAGIVRAMGFPLRVAAIVGLSLAQVGEFSFVLSSVGMQHGLLSAAQSQLFFAVAVLSLLATPFLIRAASWGESALRRRAPAVGGAELAAATGRARAIGLPGLAGSGAAELKDHVVIAGYGVNGRNVARTLRELGIPYVVLDLDPGIIRRARDSGERILFGDVSRPESLRACALARAAMVVLAISDVRATRFAIAQVRRENPDAYIIARTRQVREVAELMRLGADEVIPEEFETSIAIVMRVLRRYHVPGNVMRLQEAALRREGYSFLRGGDLAGSLMHSIEGMLAGAATDSFYLEADSPMIGQTLARLDLRGRTRALVIAVIRGGEHMVNPGPDIELRAGDVLVLVGDHQALEQASHLLEGPRTE